MDLANYDLEGLKELQRLVAAEIATRQQQELERARQEIRAIAERAGVPLSQLMSSASLKFKVRGTGPAVIRYRHPTQPGLQWTGRGRQPKWIKEWLEAGESLDKLRAV